MGERPLESGETTLSGGARSERALLNEADRLLDLGHELGVQRAELAAQAELLQRQRVELAAANERYFELYEIAPIGYLTLGRSGLVTRANLTASAFLGIERRALVGTLVYELLTPPDGEALRRALKHAFERELHVSLDVAFSQRARAPLSAKLTLTQSGQSVVVAMQDLGEERTLGAKLREREEELQAIWDIVTDAIVTLDDHRRVEACNQAALRLFERPREHLLGASIARLVPGFPETATSGRVELIAHAGERGETVPVEVAVSALQGRSGRLLAVIADTRSRRQELVARTEALLAFNQIAEHIEDAFYIVTAASGRSLYASRAFAAIYGRPVVAHESEPWPRLGWVHPEDRARVSDAADRARDGGTFDLEYRIVLPNGELRVVHDRASMLADGERITGIVRDVTREKRLAEELEQAQRLEAMGTLASGVAHDFNNLLMGIGGCVQLALGRVDASEPAYGYLRLAADAVLRGANLTRQILRIGDTRRRSDGQVVLDDMVLGARELVQSLIGERITLSIACGAPGVRVSAETADLEQIMMNLASNARDAMPTGGVLTLVTELADGCVKLSVRDTGTGMSATVKARVFEPFFTTKRVGRGTGLGLATVFALARRLGGSVAVESAEGRGTTVAVSLPIAKRPSEAPALASGVPESGGETVLMVDDDPLVRLTVENHLEALGYRALVASNAEEAIGLCEDESLGIDLVITDIMLPGLLGPELSRALRSRQKRFPVLYMSAHPREELVQDGLLEPTARVLTKPFDASALSEALTYAFEDARSAPASSSRRTLIVDDHPDVTEVLRELLEREGHEVAVANTAEEALEAASHFEPEVVLCDVDLGQGMNGYELATELRRRPGLARALFVALSGFPPNEIRERARDAGFARVLGKPLDPAKLRRILREPRL